MSEAKHSPLPWDWFKNPYSETIVRDCEGHRVAKCDSLCMRNRDEMNAANAAFIVDAVNGWDDLLAEKWHLADNNRALAAELEKTWAELDKLRDMVNRLLPLAMAAGALDGKLKTAADACFKEATELLGNIVEVEDGK